MNRFIRIASGDRAVAFPLVENNKISEPCRFKRQIYLQFVLTLRNLNMATYFSVGIKKKIAIGKFMLAMQVQKSDRMKPVLCPQFEERKFQHFDLRFS